MSALILALNAGSSTLKYALFEREGASERELFNGNLGRQGEGEEALFDRVLRELEAKGLPAPAAIAHRLVHGGERFVAPVKVTDEVLHELEQLTRLAPLHLPPALALLRAARARFPSALHVGCFDTAFHAHLPLVAARLPLPLALRQRGIRRYGFHGLSYEHALSTLGSPPPARVILAHLGSGMSLAAVQDGVCIDTSMGLTPSGGVMMGSRTGDLDPGVLCHLQRELGYSADQLEHVINHDSGLEGLCGSANMVEILERYEAGEPQARAALEQLAYAIKKQIGAYVAALGGVDTLVFTGGVGEHAALVRELCCAGLGELGILLDPQKNADNAELLSPPGARCEVRIVVANEDVVLARAARALLT